MKKILIPLILFPYFAFAQYPGNANQKITLGEQTTADGLVYRGLASSDTIRKPSIDTMAYMVLDTTSNLLWHYKKATDNKWVQAAGGDTTLIGYVNTYGTQTVNGVKTLTSNLIIKNSKEPVRTTVVTTQGFAADTTNWTRGSGWTFNGTQAVATAATGDLTYTPALTITSGNAYEITYTITGYTAGTLTARVGNANLALPIYNITNNIIVTLPTNATGGFRFTTSTFTGNLDNVSVVEISNSASILFSGQDDNSTTLYNPLRMPNASTIGFGGGGSYITSNGLFVGTATGVNNTTGANNVFLGIQSGQNNTSGSNNIFVGLNAGRNNTIGTSNVFIGSAAGNSNINGNNNTFIGNRAGINNLSGGSNYFAGTNAGESNTVGNQNFFIGTSAGQKNTIGNDNLFFGTNVGLENIDGSSNILLGTSSGRSITSGNSNIGIGDFTFNQSTIGSTGNGNIFIGGNTGNNITGSANKNIIIGRQISLPNASGSNQITIGNLFFGTGADATETTISSNAKAGIAINNPTARLHIAAGTATASTAPLKFTSGTNLTTAEAGAMEFNGTNLFFSPSTTRHTVNHGLTGSATLNFPSTTTLLSADLTISVTGAADGDVVSLGVPNAAVNANTCYTAWVSAANTVTVRFNNYSSGTVDPASATFKVFVTK